ncbi:hypothetical protein QJQ45_010900 [Haematococcus lacustris]|nr:hypothetical protein QJQ45_010900 [Haematococcus lacustris]
MHRESKWLFEEYALEMGKTIHAREMQEREGAEMKAWCAVLLLALAASGVRGQDACSTCTWAVRMLDDALCDTGITDWLINEFDTRICPSLGPGSAEQCQAAAEALLPGERVAGSTRVAIEYLRQSTSPAQLCAASGVCATHPLQASRAQAKARVWLQRAAQRDGPGCSMCEYVVTKVKEEVDDPATLEQLLAKALQACTVLPPELAATCTDLVTNYGSLLMGLVEQLDPVSSCAAVGLCTTRMLAASGATTLPPLPPALISHLGSVRGALQAGRAAAAALGPLAAGNMCDMCRLTVLEVHTLVSNPAIQAEVVNYTKALCTSLGANMADTCRDYVDLYSPMVFNMVEQYLAPDPLCQAMAKPHARAAASLAITPYSALAIASAVSSAAAQRTSTATNVAATSMAATSGSAAATTSVAAAASTLASATTKAATAAGQSASTGRQLPKRLLPGAVMDLVWKDQWVQQQTQAGLGKLAKQVLEQAMEEEVAAAA